MCDPTRAERLLGLSSTTSWLSNADCRSGSPDPSLQALSTANVAPTREHDAELDPCPAVKGRQRAIDQPASNPALLHQRTCSLTDGSGNAGIWENTLAWIASSTVRTRFGSSGDTSSPYETNTFSLAVAACKMIPASRSANLKSVGM